MTTHQANLYHLTNRRSRVERPENLLALVTEGDEAAFRLFHGATNGLLFAILLHILSHTQTAEEVLSELYDEVKRKALRLSRREESSLTWLFLIAHRLAVQRLCRELTSQPVPQKGNRRPSTTPASFINITEQRRHIRATMNSIPRSQRRMIELAFFSGLGSREIALKLGEPVEVVETELRSGLLHLFSVFRSLRFAPEPAKAKLRTE